MRARRALAALAVAILAIAGCSPQQTSPEPNDTSSSAPPAPEPDPTSEPTPQPTPESTKPQPALDSGGVSAGHPLAVDAGMEILGAGGTAVDAAIATAFAVSVVEPFASGIGGGGAAVVVPAGSDPAAYDYREVVADDGVIPASGTGVPGFVAGMAALHSDHGTLPWEDLLAPALRLAGDGFAVSDFLALRMRSDYGPGAVAGAPHLAPGGVPLAAGEQLVQSDLAQTLSTIAEDGPDSVYEGAVADQLARVDGLDPQTLAGYEVVRADPVRGALGDHTVVSAPPPLPGAPLVQMLQVAQAAGIGDVQPGSVEYVQRLSDAWEVARASATSVLGDPAWVDVPVGDMIDPGANQARADQISVTEGPDVPDESDGTVAAEAGPLEAGNTTHLTVVDRDGTMISMTNTITAFWGSGQMVGGFFLNNQLTRFDAIPSQANAPAPGKRSVSWSLPTVVLDADGRAVLGIGSPGGQQIPNVLADALVRWSLHGQDLTQSLQGPRFILTGSELTIEDSASSDLLAGISGLGWSVRPVGREAALFGSVQALQIDWEAGEVLGATDPRREADHEIG